jgi:hypothetical protein
MKDPFNWEKKILEEIIWIPELLKSKYRIIFKFRVKYVFGPYGFAKFRF